MQLLQIFIFITDCSCNSEGPSDHAACYLLCTVELATTWIWPLICV